MAHQTSNVMSMGEEVMERQERKRSRDLSVPGLGFVLFWFIGGLLLFLLLFPSLLTLFCFFFSLGGDATGLGRI